MSKTKLLFDLILFVNAKRRFTAQDVAYEFEVSVRTAHRYLTELDEMGVPLYTEPGRHGGYRVLDNRMLPPILFNENEAFALFFAFESLKYYPSFPFDIDIKLVADKLYASLPADKQRKVDQLSSVLTAWNITRRGGDPAWLNEIVDAAIDKRIVSMEYLSKTGYSVREVAPIGIYAYDGYWYLPAYDLARRETRLFRTDRIRALSRLERTHDPGVTLEQWLNRHFRREAESPVRFRVDLTREGVRQCRNQVWLEPHVVADGEDRGHVDTTIDGRDLDYVAKFFYGLGTEATVLEPPEMIGRMRALAEELLRHYGGSLSS